MIEVEVQVIFLTVVDVIDVVDFVKEMRWDDEMMMLFEIMMWQKTIKPYLMYLILEAQIVTLQLESSLLTRTNEFDLKVDTILASYAIHLNA